MKIRKVVLKNWKNFVEAEVPIQDRLFLVGPNASGKSNFLDVFRFLRDLSISGGGLQEAITRRGGVGAIRCLAARRHSDIEVNVTLESGADRWQYTLCFNQDSQRRPVIKKEEVVRNDKTLLTRPSDIDREDPALLTQTHLEQVTANRSFRELANFFASIRYLHIVPQLIREPDRSVGRTNDPFGGDFLEQVAKTPEKTRNARLRRIQQALRVAVPQLETIELWRDERGTPHLRGKYQHWRPRGAWQTEEQFSDGTLRLLGLLWAALESGGPLLLEEPELSLHPAIVRVLPQMFARVQRNSGRQILLSTHSPDLLRDEGIGLDEVFIFKPTDNGTVIERVSSLDDARYLLEGGLSLAEIVVPKTTPKEVTQLALFDEL